MFRRATALVLLGCLYGWPAFAEVTPRQLRADWAALQAARQDFRQRESTLTSAEQQDYRAYIERLQSRLADKCERLAAAGIEPPAEVACPRPALRIAPAAIDQQHEKTPAEATSALDSELESGLGEFDQRLLREQERVKAKASKSAGAGGAASGAGAAGEGQGGAGGAAASAGESGEPGSGEPGAETAGSLPSGASGAASGSARGPSGAGGPGGAGQQTASSSAPPDIPDGSDDDVVARQLREAAEKETDPQLKEKLWDEYRKYKKGSR